MICGKTLRNDEKIRRVLERAAIAMVWTYEKDEKKERSSGKKMLARGLKKVVHRMLKQVHPRLHEKQAGFQEDKICQHSWNK